MADYKELLRKAIAALPENNGASRRAVYEKARSALVGQLRAIQPPLAARDITTHRLQLEDGIRQVEQEASEAVIAKLDHGDSEDVSARTAAKPAANGHAADDAHSGRQAELDRRHHRRRSRDGVPAEGYARGPSPSSPIEPSGKAGAAEGRAAARARQAGGRCEERAQGDRRSPRTSRRRKNGRPLPSIVARAEAAKGRSGTTAFGVPSDKPAFDNGRSNDNGRRAPAIEPRRDVAAAATRIEPRDARAGRCAPDDGRAAGLRRSRRLPPRCRACAKSTSSRCSPPIRRARSTAPSRPSTARRAARPITTSTASTSSRSKTEPSFDIKPQKSFPDPVRPKKRERAERRTPSVPSVPTAARSSSTAASSARRSIPIAAASAR